MWRHAIRGLGVDIGPADVVIHARPTRRWTCRIQRSRWPWRSTPGAPAFGRSVPGKGHPMIHISTDYVFGQEHRRHCCPPTCPVQKECTPSPSKRANRRSRSGERCGCPCFAWLYDAEGREFHEHHASPCRGPRIVVGGGRPTRRVPRPSPLLAEALLDMAKLGADMPQGAFGTTVRRPHHVAWLCKCHHGGGGVGGACEAVDTSAFPTPAQRPAWSVLDGGPLEGADGVALRAHGRTRGVWALKQLVVETMCELWSHGRPRTACPGQAKGPGLDPSPPRRRDEADRDPMVGGMRRGPCLARGPHRRVLHRTVVRHGRIARQDGPGTNRINATTIANATQGLANHLKKVHGPHPADEPWRIGRGVRQPQPKPGVCPNHGRSARRERVRSLALPRTAPHPAAFLDCPGVGCRGRGGDYGEPQPTCLQRLQGLCRGWRSGRGARRMPSWSPKCVPWGHHGGRTNQDRMRVLGAEWDERSAACLPASVHPPI